MRIFDRSIGNFDGLVWHSHNLRRTIADMHEVKSCR